MNQPVHCSSCGVLLAPRRALCVQCGWHSVTGRTIPAAAYPDGIVPSVLGGLGAGAFLLFVLVIWWAPRPDVFQAGTPSDAPPAPVMVPDNGDWGRDIDEIPEPPSRRRPPYSTR